MSRWTDPEYQPMNVSACLVTRGDVDMQPIIDSLPAEWEIIVWDNGARTVTIKTSLPVKRSSSGTGWRVVNDIPDLAVYGRYAAIEHASHDLIYVQDDDVIVGDPQTIVDTLVNGYVCSHDGYHPGNKGWWCELGCGRDYNQMKKILETHVVCNTPQEFRPHYPDSGLVGFGAAFHRDAPARAFAQMWDGLLKLRKLPFDARVGGRVQDEAAKPEHWPESFLRRADNVFTVLTPRVLVDVPKQDCIYASDPNRMWRQSDHVGERDRMIELARQVRDA